MHIIIPNLGLKDIVDNAMGEFAQHKVTTINLLGAGSVFAAVIPSTATVQAKHNQYETALVASINGTPADTSAKNDRRAELEDLLTLQADNCSEIANGNLTLYLTTGYAAKDVEGSPTGPLPAVTNVLLHYGTSAGELEISWNPMADAQNFSVNVYATALDPENSKIKDFIIGKIGKTKATLAGLPTGQIVFVRVRANGGSTGNGPWSDPAEKRVP